MATIEKRTSKGQTVYYAKVRRKGRPQCAATFFRLTDARRWAKITEAAVLEDRHFPTIEAKRHNLGELINRYPAEVLPHKRPSTSRSQAKQLAWWNAHLGQYQLSDAEWAAKMVEDNRRVGERPGEIGDFRNLGMVAPGFEGQLAGRQVRESGPEIQSHQQPFRGIGAMVGNLGTRVPRRT